MRQKEILRSEEGAAPSGGGGGFGEGAAVVEPPAPPEGGGQPDNPSLWGSLFDSTTNTLRDGWQDTARDAGLPDASINYLGRDGFQGKGDEILKSALNLAQLPGKRIEDWQEADFGALDPDARDTLTRKLNNVPAEPGDYDFDIESLQGQELSDDFKGFWAAKAHEAGIDQAAFEKMFAANKEWSGLISEAQEAAQVEADKQALDSLNAHFRGKWGPQFDANVQAVESWGKENLDTENNPVHRAMMMDPVAVSLIHGHIHAVATGRSEGSLPGNAGASSGGQSYQDQFDAFLAKHGSNYTSKGEEIAAQGKYLATLAQQEAARTQQA